MFGFTYFINVSSCTSMVLYKNVSMFLYNTMDDIPQPNIMTRVKSIMENLPTHLHISVPKTLITTEAINVCKESKHRWCHRDEVNRLVKILDDWVVKHQA